jgi:hypothetical protein
MALSLKLFVELFAVGDSFMKVYLFLLFLLAALLAPESAAVPDLRKPTSALVLVLLLVVVAEHLLVLNRVGLPFTGSANFVQGGNYSSTRLDHIHVAKVALGTAFGKTSHYFDSGLQYQRFFPVPLMWLQFLLLSLASCGGLLTLAKIRSQESISRFGLSCLVWFVILKACVDGGPLNPECLAVLPVHLQFVWGKRWYHWAAVLWPLYFLGMSFVYGLQVLRLYHLLSTGFALFAVYQMLSPKRWYWCFPLLLSLFLLPVVRNHLHPALKYTTNAYNLFALILKPLQPGDTVYLNKAGSFESTDLAEVESEEVARHFHVARLRVLKPVRAYDLCRAYNLHIPKAPVFFAPQVDRMIEAKLLSPGAPPGDFLPYKTRFPAGASINYFVAGLPDGAVFLRPKTSE